MPRSTRARVCLSNVSRRDSGRERVAGLRATARRRRCRRGSATTNRTRAATRRTSQRAERAIKHRAMREQVRKRRSRSHEKGNKTTCDSHTRGASGALRRRSDRDLGRREPRPVSSNTLTGTWNVTVNRPAPLPPLKSVQVFTSSGALIEMANESQASRNCSGRRLGAHRRQTLLSDRALLPLRCQGELRGYHEDQQDHRAG